MPGTIFVFGFSIDNALFTVLSSIVKNLLNSLCDPGPMRGRSMMQRSGSPILILRPQSFFLFLFCCFAASHLHGPAWAGEAEAPIVVRGSSTLEPVVEVWAAAFGQMSETSPLNIAATGTSEGIEALLSGHADIAMASRPMSREELSAARDKELAVRETIVARMGIAVIVHRGSPVSSISMGDLAKVFSGDTRNWQAIGGPDEPIIVVRKDSGWSPDFFRRRVMGDRDFIEDSVIVDSKEDVVAEVSSRPWSIGVTGMPEVMPALDRISLIRLVGEGSGDDSTYALSRPLFFFTLDEAPLVRSFLDFVTGDQAQAMISESGLYPAMQVDSMSPDS